jgi:tetratricopeptide (TPR) repeat protein
MEEVPKGVPPQLPENAGMQQTPDAPTRLHPVDPDGRTELDARSPTGAQEVTEQVTHISKQWTDALAEAPTIASTITCASGNRRPESRLAVKTRRLTAATADSESEAGLSDYELLDRIGEGGMGVVYEARQTSLDRHLAIKMMKASTALDERRKQQFLAEAAIHADLDHPNIAPVHELGLDEEEHLFCAMKRVTGQAWDQQLPERPLNENLDILMRVADATAFAHARGVLHQDLKPENVMLGEYGEVLLMDWGLAARLDADRTHILPDSPVGGTPAYMAPEMVTGDPLRIGPWTDVYLLGAILYEIVTGHPPHTGPGATECMRHVAENEIAPTDQAGELVEIARTAMATTPRDRYKTVKAFQEALRSYQQHAESIHLYRQAEVELAAAEQTGSYERYAQALFGFREAVKLWPENAAAQTGRVDAALCYARSACARGDLEMAASLLDPDEGAHTEMRHEVETARAERQHRLRRLRILSRAAAVLVMAVLAGGALAGYFAWRSGVQGRRALLTQAFAIGLESDEWSPRRLAELAGIAEELTRLAPVEHAEATDRLHRRFAEHIRELLQSPALDPPRRERIEQAIALLASRDPARAGRLETAYQDRLATWDPVFTLEPPYASVQQVFPDAGLQRSGTGLALWSRGPKQRTLLSHPPCPVPAQLELTLTLPVGEEVTLLLHARQPDASADRPAYRFVAARTGLEDPTQDRGGMQLRILRGKTLLQAGTVDLQPDAPVRLTATRTADRLSFQADEAPPLHFMEIFPAGIRDGHFGLQISRAAELHTLRGLSRVEATAPSPLEEGDRLYLAGEHLEALDFYRTQLAVASTDAVRAECRYKEGLALTALERPQEATPLWEEAALTETTRWGVLAACQLWRAHLQAGRDAEADAILATLLAGRYTFTDLATLLPKSAREEILSSYIEAGTGFDAVTFVSEKRVRNLRRCLAIQQLFGSDPYWTWRSLVRAHWMNGENDEAFALAREGLDSFQMGAETAAMELVAWLFCSQGRAGEARVRLETYLAELEETGRLGTHQEAGAQLARARALFALDRPEAADEALARVLALARTEGGCTTRHWVHACCLYGQRAFEAGDPATAKRYWTAGFYRSRNLDRARREASEASPLEIGAGTEAMLLWVMGSRTGELTNADLEALGRRYAPGAMQSFIDRVPPNCYRIARGIWQRPRGRHLASRIARLDLTLREYLYLPGVLLGAEGIREVLCRGTFRPGEEAFAHHTVQAGLTAYTDRTIQMHHMMLLVNVYRGSTGVFGWQGVAPTLPADLRSAFAYWFWRRHQTGPERDPAAAVLYRNASLQAAPADGPVRALLARSPRTDAREAPPSSPPAADPPEKAAPDATLRW